VSAGSHPSGRSFPGKDGLVEVSLAAGRERTVLVGVRHRTPLQIGRVLYPDAGCPEMAFVYVAMIGGGIVQGDRLTWRVDLRPGARAHVTTLSATKIYRTVDPTAGQGPTHSVDLAVGAGAVLEWWPDPVIPFRGSRFRQEVTLSVDPAGSLLYGDLLLPGRVASDERHAYAAYSSRVTATRPDGRRLFKDTQSLAPPPAGAPPLAETMPPGLDTLGTVYVLAPERHHATLAGALAAAVGGAGLAGVLAGYSLLPQGSGLAVRLLAPDGAAGRRAMRAVWQAARRVLVGADAPDERKL
jgi:urease accessory protein